MQIVATGKRLPNQVNNSAGFPAIFRGMLDVKSKAITDDICIAAASELAKFAEERGMHEKDILPRMNEWEVYPRSSCVCPQIHRTRVKQSKTQPPRTT